MTWYICEHEDGRVWLVRAKNSADARRKLAARGVDVGRIQGGRAKVHCGQISCSLYYSREECRRLPDVVPR